VTASQISARAALDLPRAWVIAGSLLLATVVVDVAFQAPGLGVGAGIIGPALFSASLLVFAFGIRGSGSITARRPLGTVALTALAFWSLAVPIVMNLSLAGDRLPDWLLAFGFVDSFVRFALALVAVVQIARAGIVPAPWNWAAGWVLAAVAGVWLAEQVVAVGATQNAAFVVSTVLTVEGLVHIGGTVFLGVVAIVLANRAGRGRDASKGSEQSTLEHA
jgi:hypothetical protein